MVLLLLALFSIFSSESNASCGGKRLPFKDREAAADLIFSGRLAAPLETAKESPVGMNRVAKIEVIKAFKGDPGKNVEIYMFVPPGESCSQDKFDLLVGQKAQKEEILFFVKDVDGKHTTSLALGSHFAFTGFAKRDIEELAKRKSKSLNK